MMSSARTFMLSAFGTSMSSKMLPLEYSISITEFPSADPRAVALPIRYAACPRAPRRSTAPSGARWFEESFEQTFAAGLRATAIAAALRPWPACAKRHSYTTRRPKNFVCMFNPGVVHQIDSLYLIRLHTPKECSPMPAQIKVTLSNFWMLRLRAA